MTIGIDDYGFPNIDGNDPYGYGYKECVSFAAWRVQNDAHQPVGLWGSGRDFAGRMAAAGYPVNGMPSSVISELCIAQWNAYEHGAGAAGHVAIVVGVNLNGSVNVEEYNWLENHSYGRRNAVFASSYIHVPVAGAHQEDDLMAGAFIQYNKQNHNFYVEDGALKHHVFDPGNSKTDTQVISAAGPCKGDVKAWPPVADIEGGDPVVHVMTTGTDGRPVEVCQKPGASSWNRTL